MSDNWVVQNIENALETWNEKQSEIWTLLTQSPEDFKGGSIWNVMVNINGAVQAMVVDKAMGASSIVQEKYITVTVHKDSYEEAKAYFSRIETEFSARLKKLGSKLIDFDVNDRLHILHDFYRIGEEENFEFDLNLANKRGHSYKDTICPDSIEFKRDYIRIDDKFVRVLYLRDYASGISDEFISKLTSINRNLMLSIDIEPVPAHKASNQVEKVLLGINTEITNWKRKQSSNGNYGADVPYDMAVRKEKAEDLLHDINDRDQRMFRCVLTMVILADSILDLGKKLMPVGMLIILDSIFNRVTANRAKGKKTYIFIDEIYLLFQYEYSANFLEVLWKRVRKYGAYATGITQNVEDLLRSPTARTMLANSELVVMLNQAATDRIQLAELLGISDEELRYITNSEVGHGLLKIGSSLVPFENKFPKNSLYKLMSTKPGEK